MLAPLVSVLYAHKQTLSSAFIPLWITIHSSRSLPFCMSSAFHFMLAMLHARMRSGVRVHFQALFASHNSNFLIYSFTSLAKSQPGECTCTHARARAYFRVKLACECFVCVCFKSIIQGWRNWMLKCCVSLEFAGFVSPNALLLAYFHISWPHITYWGPLTWG